MKEAAVAFEKLIGIMDELREKCPWDRKQTIQTLRSMTIEETYELTDAIAKEDWQNIKEELGDLLLHITFYAKIAAEKNEFTFEQVIESVCNKLIIRHPHIYGDVQVKDEEDVKRNWEAIKQKEGKSSVMSGVPAALPAVVKAIRIQEKAKQVGFEWSNAADVWKKVEEEMEELQEAVASENAAHTEEEFGDVLFSLINYARFLHLDADAALEKVNIKFLKRFEKMELRANENGKTLHNMTLEEMDVIWNLIKHEK
ncbi:nucleoside triphosphate pyrophosphohydrolase [soil metagenome]